MKYRKKPVEVEAFHLTPDNPAPQWWKDAIAAKQVTLREFPNCPLIHTLEGDHIANIGDWVIRGVKGELYPCKPDIFELTYEAVEDENKSQNTAA